MGARTGPSACGAVASTAALRSLAVTHWSLEAGATASGIEASALIAGVPEARTGVLQGAFVPAVPMDDTLPATLDPATTDPTPNVPPRSAAVSAVLAFRA